MDWLSRRRYLIGSTVLLILFNKCSMRVTEPPPREPMDLEENVCMGPRSCGDCIAFRPACGWCADQGYSEETGYSRCDVIKNLNKRACAEITYPQSSLKVVRNDALSDAVDGTSGEAVQVAPQQVTLTLRPGESINLTVSVRQANDYPLDLYYVMDLSRSMRDDLNSLKNLAKRLAVDIGDITSNFRLGFGSFVEKTAPPFVSNAPNDLEVPCRHEDGDCLPPYNFRNHLPLNTNTDLFSERVNEAEVSGNIDLPEAGLDALMQVTVCTELIGWQPRARHVVIYTSDNAFHFAGDGKLCGIVLPNDGECHLNPETGYNDEANTYDYPSIGHLNARMRQHNVIPIFAVTSQFKTLYKDMSKFIDGSTVGTLAVDSSNVVELIEDNYATITSRVEMSDDAPGNLAVSYTSRCLNKVPVAGSRICTGLGLGETVSFDVRVQATSCPKNKLQSFSIGPIGFDEALEVTVEVLCSCDCESSSISNSDYCTDGNGTLSCGQCSCDADRYGKLCECSSLDGAGTSFEDKFKNVASCRASLNSSIACSGRGECICGECACFQRQNLAETISGRFCECDNFSCESDLNGAVCGGPERGECVCDENKRRSVCKCRQGYTGNTCDCPMATNNCLASNGLLCNLNGICTCNECKCNSTSPFSGDTCESCTTCVGQCSFYRPCVECKAFDYDSSITQEECDTCTVNVKIVQELPQINGSSLCRFPDRNSNCSLMYRFLYETLENGEILVHLEAPKNCTDLNPGGGGSGGSGGSGDPIIKDASGSELLILIIGIVAAIVVIGLALLLLGRLATHVHDKREFSRFEKERKLAVWDQSQNPIYKSSTSTFVNPLYGK